MNRADYEKGFVVHDCGCCVYVFRADLVRKMRTHHGESLICRVACDGTPGAADDKQLEATLEKKD